LGLMCTTIRKRKADTQGLTIVPQGKNLFLIRGGVIAHRAKKIEDARRRTDVLRLVGRAKWSRSSIRIAIVPAGSGTPNESNTIRGGSTFAFLTVGVDVSRGFSVMQKSKRCWLESGSLKRDLRYGFITPQDFPSVQELADKHVVKLPNRREQVRARRVLRTLCEEIPETLRVNELLTKHLEAFADRRGREGLVPSSVDRELNIFSSALRAAVDYYPELSHWKVPKIPRPKRSKRRRERVISAAEVAKVLTALRSPAQKRDRSPNGEPAERWPRLSDSVIDQRPQGRALQVAMGSSGLGRDGGSNHRN
jgi:hypothetical protein